MSLCTNTRMFIVQTIPNSTEPSTRKAVMGVDRRLAYLFIVQRWRMSTEHRQAIIATKAIPLVFPTDKLAGSDPTMYSSYELEMEELAELFAVFKEPQERVMHISGGTKEEADRAIDELHEVFRVLRTTVKTTDQQRQLAVVMGGHARLGGSSPLLDLDQDILRIIARSARFMSA
jgi:hypothetical protein